MKVYYLRIWFFLILLSINTTYATNPDKLPVIHINTDNLSSFQIGIEIGTQAKEYFPDIEQYYDYWLAELITPTQFQVIQRRSLNDLLEKMTVAQKKEIAGVAATWQLVSENRLGDGHLSLIEYQIINLLPDLNFSPDGIGIATFDQSSVDKETIVGHNLEWPNSHGIQSLQVITIYQKNENSFVSIGFAGLVTVLQGFNQDALFAALINAEPYSPYANRHSIADIDSLISYTVRHVLETSSSRNVAAKQLEKKTYSLSYNILLADKTGAQVQEYSAPKKRMHTRYWNSKLQQGFSWLSQYQLAVVDCLVLSSQTYTCRDNKDSVRWQHLKTLMTFSKQQPATAQHIATILLDTTNKHYELFTPNTLQSLYFLPESNSLYLYTSIGKPSPNNKKRYAAYLDLLPPPQTWSVKLKWFIWPVILLMLFAVISVKR